MSAELSGTLTQKLQQLDAILAHLYAVRRDLDPLEEPAVVSRPVNGPPARAWWIAGLALVAALGIFTLWCWSTFANPPLHAGRPAVAEQAAAQAAA